MTDRGMSPPTPTVEHLTTIFRRIRQSDIRIPAFQREFVWDEAQILELLESVYRGFPIGSLLFWRVDREVLKIAPPEITTFPTQENKYPASFILDGLQRVSTLFGVCHFGETTHDSKFNVCFDLEAGEFFNADGANPPDAHVPLASLFNPKAFLEVQRRLMSLEAGEELVEKAIRLHSIFQEYMLPIVTISHESPDQVVLIFERVNTTGTRLSSVDFMRAITWSQEFDLNREIDNIVTPFRERNFAFDDDTIIKALGLVFDLAPLPNVLMSLRERNHAELAEAVGSVKAALDRLVRFLSDNLKIGTDQFVPYEGQLLVMLNIFMKRESLTRNEARKLVAWFRATSFNEALKGRPDHFVANMIVAVERGVLEGDALEDIRIGMVPEELVDKRFIKGKALSTAFVELLVLHGAQSIFSSDRVPENLYMNEFSQNQYLPIFGLDEIRGALGQNLKSSKVIPNVMLIPELDRMILSTTPVIDLICKVIEESGDVARQRLKSQFVDDESIEALRSRDVSRFLRARSSAIIEFAKVSIDLTR